MEYFNGTKVIQEKRYKGFNCIQLDCTTEVRHPIPPSYLHSWTSYEYIWWIEGLCGRMRDCETSFAACKRAINEHLEDERMAQLEEEEEATWREMFEAEYRRMESEMREGVE